MDAKSRFSEERYRIIDAKAAWNNPSNSRGGISHYILQWRPSWGDFNYRQYKVVEFNNGGRYEVEIPETLPGKIYAIRVVVAYSNQNHIATDEKKVPSQANSLLDAIKTHLIDAHSKDQPWLVDTWRYADRGLAIYPSTRSSVALTSTGGDRASDQYPDGRLIQTLAGSLTMSHYTPNNPQGYIEDEAAIIAHELAHVYTLTGGITKNEAPIAIGHLYLEILAREHATQRCLPDELYAVMGGDGAFLNITPRGSIKRWPGYWKECGFNLDQKTNDEVVGYVGDIIKKVFLEQEMPQWFYDTYQKPDKSIDLDKLWSDIATKTVDRRLQIIVYGLKDEFGGYCSTETVRQFAAGEVDSIDTPWRDAGNCPT